MTTMVLSIPNDSSNSSENIEPSELLQVLVHVQAEVINPNIARRRANVWLTMHAGHLLMVENPELILEDTLQWRFDVFLSVPQLDKPGMVARSHIGQIRLDARSGEIIESTALVEELKANANALAAS